MISLSRMGGFEDLPDVLQSVLRITCGGLIYSVLHAVDPFRPSR
ncbi:hypothetical protein [Tessaracoccus sp. OS52]|nr:hypothetical protein [Tessaracoccus sp. OS52]